jgi:hypothetical protein
VRQVLSKLLSLKKRLGVFQKLSLHSLERRTEKQLNIFLNSQKNAAEENKFKDVLLYDDQLQTI